MLFLLRFICISLILIAVNLVLPDVKLGGRYLILFEALLMTVTSYWLRCFFQNRILPRYQRVFAGAGILIGFFLVHFLFPGVNLSLLGILVLYLGAVLLEIILPSFPWVHRYDTKGNNNH